MILLVEDDRALGPVLLGALARIGRVELAVTGREALDVASRLEPDVVVLDLGLPDIDGVEVCRELRRWFHNPIVVLSADGAEDRKIDALDEGADDYVTKPFAMGELHARLRVALRHRGIVAALHDGRRLVVGDAVIDTAARTVSVGGRPVTLAAKEFDLLALLARTPGRVLTHGTLVEGVWGAGAPRKLESLRVHMTAVRKKLGEGPGCPRIVSEPGVGYRLTLDPSD